MVPEAGTTAGTTGGTTGGTDPATDIPRPDADQTATEPDSEMAAMPRALCSRSPLGLTAMISTRAAGRRPPSSRLSEPS